MNILNGGVKAAVVFSALEEMKGGGRMRGQLWSTVYLYPVEFSQVAKFFLESVKLAARSAASWTCGNNCTGR